MNENVAMNAPCNTKASDPNPTILNLHQAMGRLNGAANEVFYQINQSRGYESSIHSYPSLLPDPLADSKTTPPITLVQKIESTIYLLEQAIGELQRHNKFLGEHLTTD